MAAVEGEAVPRRRGRAEFARYKADVKERGKPFYPYAMFHDTIMSLVVVVVIVGLAVIWKWTSYGPHHDGTDTGLLGPDVSTRRPTRARRASCRGRTGTSTSSSTCSGSSSGRSRSSSARSASRRSASSCCSRCRSSTGARSGGSSRRPVAMVAAVLVVLSMGVLTWKGATAKEALASEVIADVPTLDQGGASAAGRVPGAKLFATAGCTACHTYLGAGRRRTSARRT